MSRVSCAAPPARVWALVARPDRWHEWSPHVAGAEGLGSPEVEAGAKGSVVLRGGLKLPARVTEVVAGESWTWEVGGLRIRHAVYPGQAGGSTLEMGVEGTMLPWSLAALAYAPLVALIARNIARVAAR